MMFSLLFALATLVTLVSVEGKYPETHSPATLELYNQWRQQYNRNYVHEEELWESRPKTSRSDPAQFGLNQFADMTLAEFQKKILQPPRPAARQEHKLRRANVTVKAPASFDWTDQSNVVTSVKDQGQAGTCWAFAGCANVESLFALKTGSASPDLSTQALNDCDGLADVATQALACGPLGATMPGFYEYVVDQGGLMTWEDYPYCMGYGDCSPCAPPGYSDYYCGSWPIRPCSEADSCAAKYDTSKFVSGLKVSNYAFFTTSETGLLDDLVETGPLVAGIDATDLQFYQSGILEPVLCNSVNLNHAVLLTGYNEASDGTAYWRFKNSWSTGWGEEGFGRIIRGGGACGINADVSSAVLG